MRVVVAEDSVLLREGVVRLLQEAGMDVVGQAGDAEDLLRKVRAHKPDVALVDIRMPPTQTDEGLRAAATIRSEQPQTGVLVLSQYVEEAYALELLAEGRSNHGIAEALVVTERAVEKHVTSIFTKLNLPPAEDDHRRVLAVLTYLR